MPRREQQRNKSIPISQQAQQKGGTFGFPEMTKKRILPA